AHLDLEHGEIGGGVRADHPGLDALVVREADLDLPGALDDVVVRDDVARLVDDEAGAEGLLALDLGQPERVAEERVGRNVHDLGGGHLHHARRRALVDLVDGERLALPEVDRGRPGQVLDLADGRGRTAEAPEESGAAECEARADPGCGHETRGPREDALSPAQIHWPGYSDA